MSNRFKPGLARAMALHRGLDVSPAIVVLVSVIVAPAHPSVESPFR